MYTPNRREPGAGYSFRDEASYQIWLAQQAANAARTTAANQGAARPIGPPASMGGASGMPDKLYQPSLTGIRMPQVGAQRPGGAYDYAPSEYTRQAQMRQYNISPGDALKARRAGQDPMQSVYDAQVYAQDTQRAAEEAAMPQGPYGPAGAPGMQSPNVYGNAGQPMPQPYYGGGYGNGQLPQGQDAQGPQAAGYGNYMGGALPPIAGYGSARYGRQIKNRYGDLEPTPEEIAAYEAYQGAVDAYGNKISAIDPNELAWQARMESAYNQEQAQMSPEYQAMLRQKYMAMNAEPIVRSAQMAERDVGRDYARRGYASPAQMDTVAGIRRGAAADIGRQGMSYDLAASQQNRDAAARLSQSARAGAQYASGRRDTGLNYGQNQLGNIYQSGQYGTATQFRPMQRGTDLYALLKDTEQRRGW